MNKRLIPLLAACLLLTSCSQLPVAREMEDMALLRTMGVDGAPEGAAGADRLWANLYDALIAADGAVPAELRERLGDGYAAYLAVRMRPRACPA